jgi:hypothetical protein
MPEKYWMEVHWPEPDGAPLPDLYLWFTDKETVGGQPDRYHAGDKIVFYLTLKNPHPNGTSGPGAVFAVGSATGESEEIDRRVKDKRYTRRMKVSPLLYAEKTAWIPRLDVNRIVGWEPGFKYQQAMSLSREKYEAIAKELSRRSGKAVPAELGDDRGYWVTTQWPHATDTDSNTPHDGVYLPDDRKEAGRNLKPGDLVAIYESLGGREIVIREMSGKKRKVPRHRGKEGVVGIVAVVSSLHENPGAEPEEYDDGTKIWWRWYAETKPYLLSGFLAREELNHILGYEPGNILRGFGDLHSGLKKVTKDEFCQILESFRSMGVSPAVRAMLKRMKGTGHAWGGGESAVHKTLKERVAAAPEKLLGERGLTTVAVEHQFPTNDRADIILKDAQGRIIGLEIEPAVGPDEPVGILQAIKYRYMAALMFEKRFEDSRSFLVAHEISPEAREVCGLYDVECFEVAKE